ncbi:PHB depolymerase family esterase [Nocardia sp. SYP-A9097]|uniref:extracellular catalytic domain type 1 short-chain-length polyhydroxyalkanoate depolymerase n=1 Tax=Nocardia sp. SYP-A9097 TaxID=2663237 RepID=UPI0028169DA7|nr:PHB depolymerase family esterase [Nocardia sp. SYP-A9097]
MTAARVAATAASAALIMLTAGCGHPFARATDDVTVSFEYGGLQRQYLIHRPAGVGARPPVVLVFHGGGGTAESMTNSAGFDRLADSEGFVAVYPVGYEKSWSDGRGADTKAGAAGIDDVGFVSALIDRIVAQDGVDADRVYATGISNGGMFTQDLGCRLSDKLAAIAPVAGPLPAADESACATTHPLPVLEIHGTADPIVPYDGGPVRVTSGNHGGSGSSPVLSVAATQQLWRTKDGCGPVTSTPLAPTTDDGTTVTIESADCANGGKVQLYSITGGGHTWPDGPQYLPAGLVGKVSHQFDATQVIWRFLSAFHR